MKQTGFVLMMMIIIFIAVPEMNSLAADKADVPERLPRDPFAQTPTIRDFLGSDSVNGKGIDMEMIRMKGFMVVQKMKIAVIDVKNAGSLTVCPGTRVELEEKGVPFFTVSSVTPGGVMVTFKDGEEVWYEYE